MSAINYVGPVIRATLLTGPHYADAAAPKLFRESKGRQSGLQWA